MTFIFEIGKPFQWLPFIFMSEICLRAGWLFFAVAIHDKSYAELIRTARWASQTSWLKRMK